MDSNLEKLRKDAEKMLKNNLNLKNDIPILEFNKIIHDLKVYQIELELQNEELRNTQKLLEDSRNSYAQLYNEAPAGYVTLSDNSMVLQANQTFANMVNRDLRQIVNLSFTEFIDDEYTTIFMSRFNAIFKHPQGKSIELKLTRQKGKSFFVRITGNIIANKLNNNEINPSKLFLIITDITEQKNIENELKNKEKQYKELAIELESIIDHIPGLVFYKDIKNNFIRVNKYFAEAHNKPKTELENVNLAELYPASIAEKYYQDDLSVINTGVAKLNFEEEWETANGLKWVNTSKIPFKNENGDIIGVIGISLDITDRKQAYEKISKLSQAIEQSPVSVVITNVEGNIEYVNPKFESVTGYSYEEVLGNNPRVLKSGDKSIEFYKELWDCITNGKVWRGEFRNKKKNGDFYWESSSISSIKTNEGIITHFIAVKEDITDRKLIEAEIQLKNAELLTINAEKDKFFSIIAHDLRSPFNSFLGLTQIMANEINTLTMSELQRIAVNMEKSANNLYNLLENLLQWSQVHQGLMQFKPKELSLNNLINNCIENYFDIAKNKNISLASKYSKNTDIIVFADENMLKLVLRNLISNAIKFTNTNGEIQIIAEQINNQTIISIKDNGIGINKETLNKLFKVEESFSSNGTHNEKGTGLGLLLCKEFIVKHGGKIWLESEEGKGSCFYISIP